MAYLTDPERLHNQNLANLHALLDLSAFTPEQQPMVLAMVSAYGAPELAQHLRFSAGAMAAARKAIKKRQKVLYDVELVLHALDKSLLYQEPLGFLNRAAVISQAKHHKQTRAMVAVDYWQPHLEGSIVLIGEASTALWRLVELLRSGAPKPALVIATACDFVQAAAAKQHLWDSHADLGVECILVSGTYGGAVLAATALNALLQHYPVATPLSTA